MAKRKYPLCNPAECEIPSICPGCPDPSLDAGWKAEGGEGYRTLCPHCAGVLPEQDALEAERDALKAKLAEIEGWLKKPDCLSVCVDYLLARFFPEDADGQN